MDCLVCECCHPISHPMPHAASNSIHCLFLFHIAVARCPTHNNKWHSRHPDSRKHFNENDGIFIACALVARCDQSGDGDISAAQLKCDEPLMTARITFILLFVCVDVSSKPHGNYIHLLRDKCLGFVSHAFVSGPNIDSHTRIETNALPISVARASTLICTRID